MGLGGRRVTRALSPAAGWIVLVVAVSVGACDFLPGDALPVAHRPTVVGVIRSASTNAADDRVVVLKDGQSFTEPREERGALDMHGASPQPGMLLLDGATNGSHWWTVLETAPGGCWDGDPGAGDAYRVWDLGSTILFTDGLELPKAQGFNASKPSHMTHGHLGWDYWDARRFCVNERGEVTYADSDWR